MQPVSWEFTLRSCVLRHKGYLIIYFTRYPPTPMAEKLSVSCPSGGFSVEKLRATGIAPASFSVVLAWNTYLASRRDL